MKKFDIMCKEKTANNSINLKHIQKLDAILRLKAIEKEVARLSRIEIQKEEITPLLNLIHCPKIPKSIRKNFGDYLRLTNYLDLSNSGNGEIGKKIEEVSADKSQYTIKNKLTQQDIIKKNVQIRSFATNLDKLSQPAKRGKGVLSITDDERNRLKFILSEEEESFRRNGFHLSTESAALLNQIDSQLESFGMKRETEREEESSSKNKNKINVKNRLKKIDQMLDVLQSACQQKTQPLQLQKNK